MSPPRHTSGARANGFAEGRAGAARQPSWMHGWIALAAMALLVAGLLFLRWRNARESRDRAARHAFSRRLIEKQEHERKRLARELHDGLGQDLLIIRNRALLVLRSMEMGAGAREQLNVISDIASGSLESIRGLARNLTPHQLDHLGLSSALQAMTEAVAETSSIDLDVRIGEVDSLLPRESEINVYRIVQEALTNVVRHSGATTATVRLERGVRFLHLGITDDGHGFRAPLDRGTASPSGFGLSSMHERARILGGTLHVRSEPGRGVQIEVSIPMSTMRVAPRATASTATETP